MAKISRLKRRIAELEAELFKLRSGSVQPSKPRKTAQGKPEAPAQGA